MSRNPGGTCGRNSWGDVWQEFRPLHPAYAVALHVAPKVLEAFLRLHLPSACDTKPTTNYDGLLFNNWSILCLNVFMHDR